MLAAVALSACSTTPGGKLAVKALGNHTYEVSTHVIGSFSGAATVQSENDQTATAYCAEKKQRMVVVDRRGYGGIAPQDILTFKCNDLTAASASQPLLGSAQP